jgi:hypothetical protein
MVISFLPSWEIITLVGGGGENILEPVLISTGVSPLAPPLPELLFPSFFAFRTGQARTSPAVPATAVDTHSYLELDSLAYHSLMNR